MVYYVWVEEMSGQYVQISLWVFVEIVLFVSLICYLFVFGGCWLVMKGVCLDDELKIFFVGIVVEVIILFVVLGFDVE